MSFSGSRLIDEGTRESARLRLSCSDSLPAHGWQRSLLRGTLTSQSLRKRAASMITAPHDGKYAVVTMKEDTFLYPSTASMNCQRKDLRPRSSIGALRSFLKGFLKQ